MMKKMIVTTALAAGFLSIAPHAMAISDHSGNGAKQAFGNSKAEGDMSPQLSLAQGSLDKPCIGLPVKANIGSLVGLINIAVQDIPILSAPQNQQCTENSTQAKGDEPLSHILSDIPVLSGNGEFNG
jgi:hypothetical protein